MTSFDDTVVTLLLQPMGAGRITIDDVLRLAVELDPTRGPQPRRISAATHNLRRAAEILWHGGDSAGREGALRGRPGEGAPGQAFAFDSSMTFLAICEGIGSWPMYSRVNVPVPCDIERSSMA